MIDTKNFTNELIDLWNDYYNTDKVYDIIQISKNIIDIKCENKKIANEFADYINIHFNKPLCHDFRRGNGCYQFSIYTDLLNDETLLKESKRFLKLDESKKSARKSLMESTDIFDTLENAWDKSTMNNNVFEKTVLKLKTDSFKDPFDKYSTIYMFADGSSIDCDSLDPFDCEWCTYVSEDLSFVHEFKK